MTEVPQVPDKKEKLTEEEKETIIKDLDDGVLELVVYNGTSPAWKNFKKIRYSESKKRAEVVQCNQCKGLLRFKAFSGTTHLNRHKCNDLIAVEGESKFKTLTPEQTEEEARKLITKNAIKLCTEDLTAWETLNGSPNFVDFLQTFALVTRKFGYIDLKSVFPSGGNVRRGIIDMKEANLKDIYLSFREALKNNWCSATLEIPKNCSNTVVMRLQYFEKDLSSLVNKTIFLMKIKDDQNAESILESLIENFINFGGDENDLQNLPIVTPNNEKLVKALIFPYSRENCLADTINNILNAAFNMSSSCIREITELMNNCKCIVTFFKNSGTYDLDVKDDVSSDNWQCKFAVLSSLNDCYEDFAAILNNNNETALKFNKRKAEELISFLAPFMEAIDHLSSTTYATRNKILLWWIVLKEHLKSTEKYSFEVKNLINSTRSFFDSSFHLTMDHKIDCFLDPRYKSLNMIPVNERIETIIKVRNLLKNIEEDNIDVAEARPDYTPEVKKSRLATFESNGKDNPKPSCSKASIVPKTKDRFERFETCESDIQQDDEIDVYLKLPIVKSSHFKSEFEVISKFWNGKKKMLPSLYKLATTRLHVPACCGVVGLIYPNLKENHKLQDINDLLIIKDNL